MFTNNASSSLAAAINDSQTTITLETGEGDRFPELVGAQIFVLTVVNLTTGDREIMNVTARVNDTLTVERGCEDTDPVEFAAGALAQLRVSADTLHYFQELLGG
jgi:hypothetical protein